jgi:hypothetical protein
MSTIALPRWYRSGLLDFLVPEGEVEFPDVPIVPGKSLVPVTGSPLRIYVADDRDGTATGTLALTLGQNEDINDLLFCSVAASNFNLVVPTNVPAIPYSFSGGSVAASILPSTDILRAKVAATSTLGGSTVMNGWLEILLAFVDDPSEPE